MTTAIDSEPQIQFLNCWNTISETLLNFLNTLNTKSYPQTLITKPLTPLAKSNFHFKTVLPVLKTKLCSQIRNKAIKNRNRNQEQSKMTNTIKRSVDTTPKNIKHVVQNIYSHSQGEVHFESQNKCYIFPSLSIDKLNMFYHSSKLVRNYFFALLPLLFFGSSSSLYPTSHTHSSSQIVSIHCQTSTACLLSELAYIGCVTSLETRVFNFELLCLKADSCVGVVFTFCEIQSNPCSLPRFYQNLEEAANQCTYRYLFGHSEHLSRPQVFQNVANQSSYPSPKSPKMSPIACLAVLHCQSSANV